MPTITQVSADPQSMLTSAPAIYSPVLNVHTAALQDLSLAPFVSIPAGPAQIGYNEGFSDETPSHMANINTFDIAIYPVTNAAYAAFMADTFVSYPHYWNDTRLNHPNQPVVGVTWNAANSYCRWLTRRLRAAGVLPANHVLRLPTEIEWEKAASWDPQQMRQRRYPWGDTWDASRVVSAASGSGIPDVVGRRPEDASAYGVHDLLGNVWEWTSSLYANYPGASMLFADTSCYVIRGGSSAMRPTYMRCSYRCRLPADHWRYHLGFRVVLAAPM